MNELCRDVLMSALGTPVFSDQHVSRMLPVKSQSMQTATKHNASKINGMALGPLDLGRM